MLTATRFGSYDRELEKSARKDECGKGTPLSANSIRRTVNTEDWTATRATKTGNARVVDVDADTLKVLATHKVARAEVSFDFAKAGAYVFGDDEGGIRSPDAMMSRWDRRMTWIATKHPTLRRVTI